MVILTVECSYKMVLSLIITLHHETSIVKDMKGAALLHQKVTKKPDDANNCAFN